MFIYLVKMISNKINPTIATVIHIGENTHHHDHVITLHSFNVIKTIVNRPVKPIPVED
jgi:uncharacterized Zn-binding protein involved in type VI secretion